MLYGLHVSALLHVSLLCMYTPPPHAPPPYTALPHTPPPHILSPHPHTHTYMVCTQESHLFVVAIAPSSPEFVQVQCDGCGATINGRWYRDMDIEEDLDLCSNCFTRELSRARTHNSLHCNICLLKQKPEMLYCLHPLPFPSPPLPPSSSSSPCALPLPRWDWKPARCPLQG